MSYLIEDRPIGADQHESVWFKDDISFEPGLVFLYAPWCGFCQRAKENMHIAELKQQHGNKFRMHIAHENPDVVTFVNNLIKIFSMSAEEINLVGFGKDTDTNLWQVTGYPTMFIITAENTVIPYKGNRDYQTANDLINNCCYPSFQIVR